MRIYSLVEWEAKAVLLPWSELRSRVTVGWNGIMEGGFAFNWIAIAIYSRLEDVSDQENTAHDWSCKDFSILVGVDVVRGAIIPLQTYIYIYNVDWFTLTWSEALTAIPLQLLQKYIYIYIRSAIPLQIYICIYLQGGWRWLAPFHRKYICISEGAISQHSLHVRVVVVASQSPTDADMRRTTFKQLLQQQKDRLNDPLQQKTHCLNKDIYITTQRSGPSVVSCMS